MTTTSLSKLALHCLFGVAIAACSSSSDSGGTTTDGGTKTDTAGGGTDTAGGGSDTASGSDTKSGGDAVGTDTKSGGDTTPGDSGDDSACAATTTQSTCQKCCNDAHPDSYTAFATTLITCACKAGNCDTQCKTTACASTPATPDATCTSCLNTIQSGACKADLDACRAADCAPFFGCVAAQCAGKK